MAKRGKGSVDSTQTHTTRTANLQIKINELKNAWDTEIVSGDLYILCNSPIYHQNIVFMFVFCFVFVFFAVCYYKLYKHVYYLYFFYLKVTIGKYVNVLQIFRFHHLFFSVVSCFSNWVSESTEIMLFQFYSAACSYQIPKYTILFNQTHKRKGRGSWKVEEVLRMYCQCKK